MRKLPFDAIPHGHYYEFERLKKTWPGAVFELLLGLFLLPAAIYLIKPEVSLIWLYACAFSASLFDIGVGLGIKSIKKINHLLHWWHDKVDNRTMWTCEVFETIILLSVLVLAIRAA